VRRLSVLLRRYHADVLHSFLFHANIIGRVAAMLARTPVVVSAIRVAEARRYHWWIDRWTRRLVDRYTCVCESVRREAVGRLGVPERRVVAIPNGVDEPRIEKPRAEVRRELGIGDDAFVFVFVGRLETQKAPDDFIRAAAEVCAVVPRACFVLVGAGTLERKLRALVRDLRINSRVRFAGWRRDAMDIMAASDALVLPSRWEGMPNVVLEAMILGKPVVASSVGGCPELVEHGATGYLVSPGDVHALAQLMSQLGANPNEAEQLGMAGRAKASRWFTVSAMIEKNEQLYVETLG